MDSLFSHRPFRKRRMYFCAVAAILIEGSLVGLAAIWPQPNSWKIPDTVTELDTGPVLGETVQELIAPKEEPVPTPDTQPTPPPDETPPPDDTPPPSDEPDMETPPPPKEKPKSAAPAAKAIPKDAKRGDHPQEGVVGGVTTAEKKTGTPGATHLGPAGGWRTPKPPYPFQARKSHLQGDGSVRVTTDGSGRVSNVIIVKSVGSGVLDYNTVNFAKANWSGPPNNSTTVPITYVLQ